MTERTTLSNAATLRQRAAQIRFLAEQTGDPRYAALFRAAARDYETGAFKIEAEERLGATTAYASAAE